MYRSYFNIYLDRNRGIPLFRQVYSKIRDEILTGHLDPGARLPATRRLAKELKISRNVVMEAYDQLHAEGYIVSRPGSYTCVANDTYYRKYKKQEPLEPKINIGDHNSAIIKFQTGISDLSMFPRKLWYRYLKKAVMDAQTSAGDYYQSEGHLELRKVICDYLYRMKGFNVNPDKIVITAGATQALSLTARLLHTRNSEAIIEDPGGYGAIKILKTAGYHLKSAKTSPTGIVPSSVVLSENTKLIYLTPSHQFPMGSILPASKRIDLLHMIKNNNIFIVEDDYDSEFRYNGPPIHPLKALDPEKVIYIGTFTKVLGPAFRMGYAVLPQTLLGPFKQMKRFSSAQFPLVDQIALKNFISEGAFEKYIYKMKKNYHRKRDLLIDTLKKTFGQTIEIFGEDAGLHLVTAFKENKFEINNRSEILHNGVFIHSVEKHAIEKGNHKDKLIFGYGNVSNHDIKRGIKNLSQPEHHPKTK